MEGHAINQKILSWLRVRSIGGGLEVTDQVLRIVIAEGEKLHTAAVRLGPGILNNGEVLDPDAFRAALAALRKELVSVRRSGRINVNVVLSSVNVYSQVFSLPMVEGADLSKAVDLNVQMLSPMDVAQAYAGWQTLGRDEQALRVEMLAAFVEKKIVDAVASALFDSGFLATSIESRALALARLLRSQGAGIDPEKSYLMISVSNAGMEFLVIRRGQLYFDYGNPWNTIMDERGEISTERFTEAFVGDFRQVSNFYGQHWGEPLQAIILSAAAFQSIATNAISSLVATPVVPLVLSNNDSLEAEWFPALGASLQPIVRKDDQINLLGGGAREIYREEETLRFLGFWRTVVPIAFGILIAAYVLANIFLGNMRTSIANQASIKISGSDLAEVNQLEASATAFNAMVVNLQQIETSLQPKYIAIQEIAILAASSSIQISKLSFAGTGAVSLSGTTQDEDSIIAFKDAVQKDSRFGAVDLPVTNIQQNGTSYSFIMTFPLSPQAFTL